MKPIKTLTTDTKSRQKQMLDDLIQEGLALLICDLTKKNARYRRHGGPRNKNGPNRAPL